MEDLKDSAANGLIFIGLVFLGKLFVYFCWPTCQEVLRAVITAINS